MGSLPGGCQALPPGAKRPAEMLRADWGEMRPSGRMDSASVGEAVGDGVETWYSKVRVHANRDLRGGSGNREWEVEVEGGWRFGGGVAGVIRRGRGEEGSCGLPSTCGPLLWGKAWLFGCFRW